MHCICQQSLRRLFLFYGCSETATPPDHLLVVPLQVTGGLVLAVALINEIKATF